MYFVLIYILSFTCIHPICRSIDEAKRKKAEASICFSMLFIFFGFRGLPILNDTAHYYVHFQDTLNYVKSQSSIFDIDFYDRFDKGYLVYENIIARFTNEPYAIILVSALIVTTFFISVTKKYSNNVGYIIFLLLGTILLTMFSGIRQGLGTCIETIALLYLIEDKKIKFVLITILAGFIHSSCFFILPVIVFRYIKLSKRNIILTLVAVGALFLMLNQVWAFVGKEDSAYLERSANRETFPFAPLMNFIVALAFLVSTIVANRRNGIEYDKIWWWISILNTSFLFLDINVQIMARFSTFFFFLSLLFWWHNIDSCNPEFKKKQMLFFGILIFAKLWITFEFRPEWHHLFPYSFYDFGLTHHQTDFGY
ncbi:MAG: EpsG family protein [Clostridium sp.]|nr:EpsG family protein [Clostridium sp.]